MADLPTFEAFYDLAKAEIQFRNPRLTDFELGSNNDAVAGAAALLAEEVARLMVAEFRKHFSDTAEGEDLAAYGRDRFGLEPAGAAASIGHLVWTVGTPGLSYTIEEGALFRGEGATVRSTEDVTVLVTDTEVLVPCQATTAGRDSNLAQQTIDTIIALHPSDPGATVAQPNRFVGGADAETDEQFRDRLRRFWRSLRRGTIEAIREAALAVPGVAFAVVDESRAHPDDGAYTALYIGDPDAHSNELLAAAVESELDAWRAAGAHIVVYGAEREELSLELTVTVRPRSDQAHIAAAIRAMVSGYTDDLSPREPLRLSRVYERAHDAHHAVLGVQVNDLVADVEPSEDWHAIRIPPENITIHFVTANA